MMPECNHRFRLVQDNDERGEGLWRTDDTWWVLCQKCGWYGTHAQVNEQMDVLEAQVKQLRAACETLVTRIDDYMDFGEHECGLCGHHHIHEDNCPYVLAKAAIAAAKSND